MVNIEYSWHSTPQLWVATFDNYDGAIDSKHPMGFGRTKEEAAGDLLEKERDAQDLKQWPVTECRCVHGLSGRCVHCDPRLAETA